MDKATVQSSAPKKTGSQPTGEQAIVFQNHGSFRKTDEEINSFIITTTESFFKRQCIKPNLLDGKSKPKHTEPGILLLVLFYCDRDAILRLRLTSQGFYYLASKIPAPNLFCPLANVSAVFHQPSSETATSLIQNKLNFAQENQLEVFTDITLAELLNSPAGPSNISEDKHFFSAVITDITELNQLQTALSNKQSPASISKLRKIDFSKLPIDSHIPEFNTLFTAIAQNLAALPSLITIVTSKIPSSMTLPPLYQSNRAITIKQIEEQGMLTTKNIVVAGAVGFGLYGIWKWWSSSNDPDDKKK